ncbi:MAG: DUF3892 domain-containing protein [Gammaproteobacteria bacterium]|nr:MAG: DUF3892 domain-containing protein [Gammaproteobacteria bacterium]
MADREVRQTKKDKDGDILALCNAGNYWSPRAKQDAINDIESKAHTYYVMLPGGIRANVHVVKGPYGKYLRTDKDTTSKNNLDDLPDCY